MSKPVAAIMVPRYSWRRSRETRSELRLTQRSHAGTMPPFRRRASGSPGASGSLLACVAPATVLET